MTLSIAFPNLESVEQVYIIGYQSDVIGAQLCKFPEEVVGEVHTALYQEYGAKPANAVKPCPGDLVAVPFGEGDEAVWCRAVVLAVTDDVVNVEHVDHGSCDTLDITKVYPLADKFCTTPQIAIQIRLTKPTKISADATRTLQITQVLDNVLPYSKLVLGEFIDAGGEEAFPIGNPCFMVKPYIPDGVSPLKIANTTYSLEDAFFVSEKNEDGTYGVQCCSVSVEVLDAMTSDLKNAERIMLGYPLPGDYVSITFLGDGYRCLIRQIIDGKYLLEHIDYGSMCLVDASEIMYLDEKFYSLPAVAIQVKMIDGNELNKDFEVFLDVNIEPTDKMARVFEARIRNKKSIGLETVVPQKMINSDVSQMEEVNVFSVDDNIYGLILSKYTYDPDGLTAKIRSSPKVVKKNLKRGDFAYMDFDETCACRVLIGNIEAGQCNVFHIDFGSIDIVSVDEIYELEESLYDIPQQAILAQFSDDSQPEIMTVLKVAINGEQIDANGFTIHSVTLCSQIANTEDSITTAVVAQVNSSPKVVRKIVYHDFDENVPEEVFCCEVKKDYVALQFTRYEEIILYELSEKLSRMYENSTQFQTNHINVGDYVAVPLEDCYYRAIVLSINNGRALVEHVDFGSRDEVPLPLNVLDEVFFDVERMGVSVEGQLNISPNETTKVLIKKLSDEHVQVNLIEPKKVVDAGVLEGQMNALSIDDKSLTNVVDEVKIEPVQLDAPTAVVENANSLKTFNSSNYVDISHCSKQMNGYHNDVIANSAPSVQVTPSSNLSADIVQRTLPFPTASNVQQMFKRRSFESRDRTFFATIVSFLSASKLGVMRTVDAGILDSLNEDLRRNEVSFDRINIGDLYYGCPVLISECNREYLCRAKIIGYDAIRNLYKVFAVDYCESLCVKADDMFVIPSVFLQQQPLSFLVKLQADDVDTHPREILPFFSTKLECCINREEMDEEIFGEVLWHGTIKNMSGDVVSQMIAKGVVLQVKPSFLPSIHSLQEDSLLDVQITKIISTYELTCTIKGHEAAVDRSLSALKRDDLFRLYMTRPNTAAVVDIEGKLHRAEVLSRPNAQMYKVSLVDYGIETCVPVNNTFECPHEVILAAPKASLELFLPEKYDMNELAKFNNELIVIKINYFIQNYGVMGTAMNTDGSPLFKEFADAAHLTNGH